MSEESYREIGFSTDKIAVFAKAVGANVKLNIHSCSCYQNPEWDYLSQVGGDRETSSGINTDYNIPALEDLLAKPCLRLSKLVWRTMSALPNNGCYLVATYQRNASSGSREADSSLVHVLRNAAWVPQDNGLFVCPAKASPDLLPAGFSFDSGQRWLKEVRWGEESEQQRQKETFARELGFSDLANLEQAKRFAAFPLEDQERFFTELERKKVELPDHSPANPERRASRVREMAAEAPKRDTQERMRSVSVGLEAVKAEAHQYHLLLQQHSVDDEIRCQICREQMPFKLDNGSSYFEKVEFLPKLIKLHYQNYLALCPNHSAMFKHANGSKDLMREMFAKIPGNELKVVLAQQNATIYFTKTHIADLRTIIEVDGGKGPIFDEDGTDS